MKVPKQLTELCPGDKFTDINTQFPKEWIVKEVGIHFTTYTAIKGQVTFARRKTDYVLVEMP